MTLSILGGVILTVAPGGRCDHQCHRWGGVILIVATGGRSDIAGWGVILIVATGRRCDIVGVIPIVATGWRCDRQWHHCRVSFSLSPPGGAVTLRGVAVIPIVATGGRCDIVYIGGCNSHIRHWGAL